MRLGPVLPFGALLAVERNAPLDAANAPGLVPRASSVPFGSIITHCTVPGKVALTFDDGPYWHTPHILDLLDQNGAKATFFINGDNWITGIDDPSQPWPEILRRIVDSGHQLGSHTWAHRDMSAADSTTRSSQMQQLDHAIANVVGKTPTYFRPPYGSCNAACLADMASMGYHVINFDLDTKDYENRTPDLIGNSMSLFADAIGAGGPSDSFLVLAHDVHEQTAVSLVPYMLDKIKQKGYQAVTVGECLGDAPANWYRSG
ncbi:carbohydrate esterase [Echria macrotheca]|uniref:Carbohydrate esterase n=1 Tax=Echria macrotheca TaxID=438768 RepID=A0AAJ0F1I7_9PEZI|nr:carbohydrate esterase [Echria macrotheca]